MNDGDHYPQGAVVSARIDRVGNEITDGAGCVLAEKWHWEASVTYAHPGHRPSTWSTAIAFGTYAEALQHIQINIASQEAV